MAGAVNDDNSLILANRPQADNVIVLTNKDNTDETYQVLIILDLLHKNGDDSVHILSRTLFLKHTQQPQRSLITVRTPV